MAAMKSLAKTGLSSLSSFGRTGPALNVVRLEALGVAPTNTALQADCPKIVQTHPPNSLEGSGFPADPLKQVRERQAVPDIPRQTQGSCSTHTTVNILHVKCFPET